MRVVPALALALALWATFLLAGKVSAAPSVHILQLPKDRDNFFVEEDLAYRRALRLARDGTYQQFNQDATATLEADRGTWEQNPQAIVLLHSTTRGLRFRAVRSGPLTVTLGGTETLDALPGLAAAIRRLLADSEAAVFRPETAAELGAPPAAVTVDSAAESFRREDLTSLLAQLDRALETERTHTYRLTPLRLPGRPLLLVLQDAFFGPDRAEEVTREYHVQRGAAPPFYFAQTDAAVFARRFEIYRDLESQWPAMTTATASAPAP